MSNNLKISIYKSEKSQYENGGDGCTIYCALSNMSNKPIKIEIAKSFVINEKGEQREHDFFLTGFIVNGEIMIQPGAHVVRGEIFLKNNSGELCPGWRYGINIIDSNTRQQMDVIFLMNDNGSWGLLQENVYESPAKLLKKKVERIEAFENKKGIRFENISFIIHDDTRFSVMLDVFLNGKDQLEENIDVKCICYDGDNDVVATNSRTIYAEDYMGYTTLEIYINETDINVIEKIRIYPE